MPSASRELRISFTGMIVPTAPHFLRQTNSIGAKAWTLTSEKATRLP